MVAKIHVEVVFALADKQQLTSVALPSGATVADAIARSAIAQSFPEQDLGKLSVGVWGHLVTREYILADGDRVEIYRNLKLDPREARRQLALAGKTMSSAGKD